MGRDKGGRWRGGRHAARPTSKADEHPGPAGAPSVTPAPVKEGGRGRRGGRAGASERRADPGAAEAARGFAAQRRPVRGGHHEGRGAGSFNPGSRRGVSGQNNARDRPSNHLREIGWKKLRELSDDSGLTIMEKLSNESTLGLFKNLTCEKDMPDDWLRLVVAILAKVSTVEYKPIVVKLFSTVCEKKFVDQLLLHISRLPYDKNANRKERIGNFFTELTILCKAILELTPSLAYENLDIVLKRASQELDEIPSFEGCDTVKVDLKLLREKLMTEKERFECMIAASKPANNLHLKPPTESDFRDLSHVPSIEDIVVETFAKPFLRPNKVNEGPYESVDDYLDVHFRLMREDFLRPLREGILEYRKALRERQKTNGKIRTRIQNIRIYDKVQMIHVDTEKERVGIVLNFDPDRKFAPNIQWKFSKRFMNGALLVLSEDEDFSSIVLATVCKKDDKELAEGKVLVELCGGSAVSRDLLRRQYMMVECQVFYGAYSHVLKALKDFNEDSFPMKTYIVYGSTQPELPNYQIRAQEANMKMKLFPRGSREGVPVDIENLSTWPSSTELGLDESQYQALSGALSNKLMLIQGPPGTGKTYVGLKIAACLIRNQELWRPKEDQRPMLVVCYTNHALDQFLTGLMRFTESIVRVGSGSKDTHLDQFSIKSLRRNGDYGAPKRLTDNIKNEKAKFNKIKSLGDRIRYCSLHLKEGLISMKTLWSYGIVSDEYQHFTDVDLFRWLCGYRENERLPDCIIACLKMFGFLDNADPAFEYLDFPQAGVTDVTMISFRRIGNLIMELAKDPQRHDAMENHLRSILKSLDEGLATVTYRHYQFEPHPLPADIWRMKTERRWQLYRNWRDTLVRILEEGFEPLSDEIDMKLGEIAKLLVTWRMVEDQHVMAAHQIVGMTTSFAAAHQENLKELKPRIVIVEEAAEVCESHVLVSLAGEVEHLIMIGDHQQLRPNITVHELGLKYNLHISMFERLIKNGVKYVTLSTQHRMRPQIARLICPAIYPNLKNHRSVHSYPGVLGVAKNVFFVDHKNPEEHVQDSLSYQNSHEAKFMACLVKYLLLQGYDASRITVLSAYKGQQHCFSKLKDQKPHLQDVRMTVVDNYQGEESDIILLSLVRSNVEDVVGFLKEENRVCVALSRARHGLFMIGNMANLTAANTVWRKVEEELRRQGSIGPALPLRCHHHGVMNNVVQPQDFSNSPAGGCLQLCKTLMACGHDCKQVCHILDMEHIKAKCLENCERPACPQQHPCPARCFQKPCPPCQVLKEEELACGHSAKMPCHVNPAQYKCRVQIESCTLPACGHERDAQCHQMARLDKLPCKMPCNLRMPCGHACKSNCHVLKDPNHEDVKCMEPCGQKRHGCTADPEHQCRLVCHQPCEDCTIRVPKTLVCGHVNNIPCNAEVVTVKCQLKCKKTLQCGHQCSKTCEEACEPCTVQVSKALPGCGHTQTMACGEPADLFKGSCEEPCQRSLPCGHPCESQCGKDCSSVRCLQKVPFPGTPACGHTIIIPCYRKDAFTPNSSELLALCRHPCPALLKPCDHQCGGSCGECLQGRLHQPCKSKCERPLLCGHLCKEACPMTCPPCTQPCELKCEHSACNHRCGEPCARCQEPCRRRCEHGECSRRCGDQCSFECKEPCPGKVEGCGHDCIGLCGDPCICKECQEEDPTEVFFGPENEEGARFVMLPDCRHLVESSSLDDWMALVNSDKPTVIKQKVCPKCSALIKSCPRYGNVMKRVAKDITSVKAQYYDTMKIRAHLDRIKEILLDLPKFPSEYRSVDRFVSQIYRFREIVDKKMPKERESGARRVPPINTSEAKNFEQKVHILRSVGQIVNKVVKSTAIKVKGKKEMQEAVEQLCSTISQRDLLRLSEQEASDINLELERLQRLMQLLQIENLLLASSTTDKMKCEEISRLLRGLLPLSEEQGREVDEKLEALAASSSCPNVTRLELSTIVAALKMGAGHWFRCPNGHPYCITECGGAMEEANCPVEGCGARIGGGNHQLRRDNTLAGDIDGAAGPAFPTAMQYY